MKFGLFYELSVPRPWTRESERTVYQNALEQVRLADELGFDQVWAVEHHFLEEYSHCPAPELFPIMPLLAERHTVVVPDLRGAGGSAKPALGYDKKTMAVDIHELTASLRLDRVRIVGHDIGLMVAYAYAAQFPEATER
jgi:pimeloyl-ACP methyl ester carboxylesterase